VKGRRRISARRQRLIENSFPHVDLFRRRRFAGAASTLYLRFFEPMAAERSTRGSPRRHDDRTCAIGRQ
jgi:hypothetical protein